MLQTNKIEIKYQKIITVRTVINVKSNDYRTIFEL